VTLEAAVETGAEVVTTTTEVVAAAVVDGAAADEVVTGAAADEVVAGAAAELETAAAAELDGPEDADPDARAAQMAAAADCAARASLVEQAPRTQVVAAAVMSLTFSGLHWQTWSSAAQVVCDLTAASMHG